MKSGQNAAETRVDVMNMNGRRASAHDIATVCGDRAR